MSSRAEAAGGRSRVTTADLPFAVLALAAGALLVYLGRSLTFWHDEWRSITFSGSWVDFLRPVNEHWSTFPLLLYRATFRAAELHSYLPYLAEVVILHLLAVTAAYVLVRRRAGHLVATLSAIPLLLLGTGSENFFWAFQTGFVGSVLFGLWALVVVEQGSRRTAIAASLLLLASLMSSGIGLVFVAVVFARAVLDPRLRLSSLAVVPPVLAYVVWYLTVGHEPVDEPDHVADPASVVRFVIRGLGHAVGSFTGLEHLPAGRALAFFLVTAFALLTGWALLRKRPLALAAGCLLGIATMYVLSGSVRAHLEFDYATVRRYVYIAGFLLVLAVADWLPEVRARRAVSGALAVVLAAAIVANVADLRDGRDEFRRNADLTRAHIDVAQQHQGKPWVDPQATLGVMPPVPLLLGTVERHGSPLRDSLFPSVVPAPSAAAYEAAFLRLVGNGFHVERGGPASGEPVSLAVIETQELVATPDGRCLALSEAGPNAAVLLSVDGGARIHVTASSDVRGAAVLGHDFPPSRRLDVELGPGQPTVVYIPDWGDGVPRPVRLDVPAANGRIRVCVARG